jgi:hypothetical protein
MTSILSDPRLFNYIIISLYAINTVRWAFAGSWGDTLYWAAALQITAAVTWGYHR